MEFKNSFDLSSYTLIVPCVSVGNVAQFAADLIISSLNMTKVDSVWSPGIVPVVGVDPYNLESTSLMVACELYANVSKKIAVLQLRSSLLKHFAKELLTSLAETVKNHSLENLIILTSSFASERHNISTVPFRYFCNSHVSNPEEFQTLEWIDYKTDQENFVIHGGGFAKKLFEISTQVKIPCVVLFKYCSEGDNVPDAIEMLDYLNKWMKFCDGEDSQRYIHPPSWTLLFGNPPPLDLY